MRIMKLKTIIIYVAIFCSLALWAIFIGCPIKQIFGVNCPGCGMTRAFLSALRLDFCAAFHYHPLFGIFMIETAYIFLRNIFPKIKLNKKAELIIISISFLLLLIVWIFRQFII